MCLENLMKETNDIFFYFLAKTSQLYSQKLPMSVIPDTLNLFLDKSNTF